jgi:GT2 family glycosyltransferase
VRERATEDRPSVTVVILSYNRREALRTTLRKMLFESDYGADLVDVVVVDNASDDGSPEMVRNEFPRVAVIERGANCGVSGINDGFAVATGDLVLGLDDDCYLPADGLRRALEAMRAHEADLVSFGVASAYDDEYRFDERYRTGLLSFWGCAVLMRREVVEALRGYDPEIFVWANELEFMLRFFDRGFRHLHLPEVVAVHMKEGERHWREYIASPAYRLNLPHIAYIAAKRLWLREAGETLLALLTIALRDAVLVDRRAIRVAPATIRAFVRGLSHHDPVGSRRVSRTYRQNFESFASPWWLSRPLGEFVRAARSGAGSAYEPAPGRRTDYYAKRPRFYPMAATTLDFRGPRATAARSRSR